MPNYQPIKIKTGEKSWTKIGVVATKEDGSMHLILDNMYLSSQVIDTCRTAEDDFSRTSTSANVFVEKDDEAKKPAAKGRRQRTVKA